MKIIRNSIIPFKGYRAMNVLGILFCRKDAVIDDVTVNHETIHTAQMKEMLYLFFYVWYVIEYLWRLMALGNFRKAYRNIGFEREAYLNERDMGYCVTRKHFSWFRYLN